MAGEGVREELQGERQSPTELVVLPEQVGIMAVLQGIATPEAGVLEA